MANAVYGKSVESVRDRVNFVLIRDKQQALRYNRKPTVAGVYMVNTDDGSDLAILRMKKLSVKLDKPLYLGVTVLDEAKRILYEWYYNYALPKWGDNFTSIATDTDSIYCWIKTEDVYEDIYADKERFDMSEYDVNCEKFGKFFCEANRRRPGKMKDENSGKIMSEMIFLRPKCYIFTLEDPLKTEEKETEVKKCNGIPKKALNQQVTKEDYLAALENPIQKSVEIVTIAKRHHDLFTMRQWKKGISGHDIKRYYVNETCSFPYGHYLISHMHNRRIDPPETDDCALWIDRFATKEML